MRKHVMGRVVCAVVALLCACGVDRGGNASDTRRGGPPVACVCPPSGTTVSCCVLDGPGVPTQPRCECLDEVEEFCPGVVVAQAGGAGCR